MLLFCIFPVATFAFLKFLFNQPTNSLKPLALAPGALPQAKESAEEKRIMMEQTIKNVQVQLQNLTTETSSNSFKFPEQRKKLVRYYTRAQRIEIALANPLFQSYVQGNFNSSEMENEELRKLIQSAVLLWKTFKLHKDPLLKLIEAYNGRLLRLGNEAKQKYPEHAEDIETQIRRMDRIFALSYENIKLVDDEFLSQIGLEFEDYLKQLK